MRISQSIKNELRKEMGNDRYSNCVSLADFNTRETNLLTTGQFVSYRIAWWNGTFFQELLLPLPKVPGPSEG